MNDLVAYAQQIANFSKLPAPYQIQVFGWLLHELKQLSHFTTKELGECFDAAHIPRPPNIASSVSKLAERKPPVILKSAQGFRLTADVRAQMSREVPLRATSVRTTQVLDSLSAQITDTRNKAFLVETLVCFKHHAYRAAIVMAWNLAFSHICDCIFSKHLPTFNSWRQKTFPKLPEVVKRTDFEDYKESQVIEICRGARIFDGTICRILSERLNRRNLAAHPSSASFQAPQAEDQISDLVRNILLNPAI